jgi:hypothetical protein
VMHEEHSLSEMYMKFLLARSMQTQADLVDQLFNSSEKRLARVLLLFWPNLVNRINRSLSSLPSRKRLWQRWSAPPAPVSAFS